MRNGNWAKLPLALWFFCRGSGNFGPCRGECLVLGYKNITNSNRCAHELRCERAVEKGRLIFHEIISILISTNIWTQLRGWGDGLTVVVTAMSDAKYQPLWQLKSVYFCWKNETYHTTLLHKSNRNLILDRKMGLSSCGESFTPNDVN